MHKTLYFSYYYTDGKYRLNDIGGKGSEIENFPSSMSVK